LVGLQPGRKDYTERFQEAVKAQADFLRGTDPDGKDKPVVIELFGLKDGGTIDGRLMALLRPELPKLKPGGTYLVEVVIRTLNMGHGFPQGTSDSNASSVEFEAGAGSLTARCRLVC